MGAGWHGSPEERALAARLGSSEKQQLATSTRLHHRSIGVGSVVGRHGQASRSPPAQPILHASAGAATAAAAVRANDGRAGVVLGDEGRRWRWSGGGGEGGEEAAVHGRADTVAGVHVPRAPGQAGAPGEGGAGAGAGPAAAPGGHLVPEQARTVAVQAARARLRRAPSQVRRAPRPRRVPQAGEARPRHTVWACALLQLHELSERLREREDRAGSGGAATASSSSCNNNNGGVGEEAEDDKRNVDVVLGCVDTDPPESCVLGGACATPADVSVESECDDHHHHHLDYDDGFPESFCATPELWEPWPLVEWNAVA